MFWLSLTCALSCASTVSEPDIRVVPVRPTSQTVRSGTPQEGEPTTLEDVIVTARRGAAQVAPEVELDGAQIDALGAYDIGEAIARLREGLGLDEAPILIINGRRVVNPGDFLGFPPDALERLEVLPQQATAAYGGSPSQRVVNLVLQPRFRGGDGRLTAAGPTAGGRSTLNLDARASSIENTNISQYGVEVSRDTALYGAERSDYLRDHPERTGVTLRPASETVAGNFSLRSEVGDWAGSVSGRAQTRTDRSALRSAEQTVEIRRQMDNLALSGGLSGRSAGWSIRLGLDGQATRAVQEGLIDTRSRNYSMDANLGADRTLWDLPAGAMSVNLSGRYGRFTSVADGPTSRTTRSVDTLGLGAVLSVPLSRAATNPEGASILGDTSVTLGATVRESDGTGGEALNVGLYWSPTPKLKFNGQWSTISESPTAQQRFEPVFFGEPRIVFDFATGQAVEVLPLIGGNPDLRPQTSGRFALTAALGPFTSWSLQGGVTFQRATSTDGIGRLPTLTPELEALFPDRFQRDANGRLISIDQRQINLGSTLMESLSTNLNFNLPVGTSAAGAPRGAVRVGLTHSWQLTNRLSLLPGLADLDRLAGDGGGVPLHQVSVVLDGRVGRFGASASGRWRSESRTRKNNGRDGPDDVRQAAFATVDLKLSYVFQGDARPSHEGARARRDDGVRLELAIDNLFDARPQARLGDGRPAPGYGRDDQDPLGRVVRLNLSRRF